METGSVCGSFYGQMSVDDEYLSDAYSFASPSSPANSEKSLESFNTLMSKSSDDLFFETFSDDYNFQQNKIENMDYVTDTTMKTFSAPRRKSMHLKQEVVAPLMKPVSLRKPKAVDKSFSETQIKLGNLYTYLNNTVYKSTTSVPSPSLASTTSSASIVSDSEESLVDVQEFDMVCKDLSNSTNAFLSETYIKSLLGVFPYNTTLSKAKPKRKSNNTGSNKQKKLKR